MGHPQLTDHEWMAIKPMLPNKPHGVRRVNDRRVLNGIFWVFPPQPSLNNGPVQRRVRRAFVATGQSVLSTTQIMDWSHFRPGTNWHHARRSVRRVCERYCERVGRSGSGAPILWKLRKNGDD